MKKLSLAMKVAFPVVLLTTQISVVQAEDAVSLNQSGELEVTVTANRREQKTINTLAPVSIITRTQIENTQAQDVIDVLRMQNGIDIARNGGKGTTTSVFLRGANSAQVLVLVDGVRVSSATTGNLDWAGLPLTQVERIEIVRGPRASLYGSDAVGGIIQIFTRKKSGSYVSATLGKYGTSGLSLGFAEKGEKTDFALNVATESSDGFSATNSRAGEFTFVPDADGYSKKSVNSSVSHQISDTTKAGMNFLYSSNEAEFDEGDSDLEVQTLSAFVTSEISDKWTTKLTVSEAKNETISASAFGTSTFDTKRTEINWQNDLTLSENTDFTVGLSHIDTDAKITGFSNFDGDITNSAIYANLLNRMGKFNLDLSARYDDHSQAGGELTGQVAAGYSISPTTNVYASYGTAFRAPNINDLYNPGFPNFSDPTIFDFAGNPDLDPEMSKSFEVGFKTNVGRYSRMDFSIFRTNVDNQIVFEGPNRQLINLDETLLKGFEVSYSGNTEKFDWNLGATIQRAVNDKTKDRLVRRPNNKFIIGAGAKVSPKTRLGIDAIISSNRIDNDFGSFPSVRTSLKSYSVVNLSLNHKVSKKVNLGVRVENVGDSIYETAHGYNTPRRGAFFTFSYKD